MLHPILLRHTVLLLAMLHPILLLPLLAMLQTILLLTMLHPIQLLLLLFAVAACLDLALPYIQCVSPEAPALICSSLHLLHWHA